jgi:PLP dependent protein
VTRAEEVSAGLAVVHRRIADACADAGRDPGEVCLVVVTKTFPAEDVRVLADLGVADVGENRHQEAVEKHAACADLGLTWHFVGAVQTNKAAAVAEYADVVHSVDRPRLVRALGRGADRAHRRLRCLVQVSLDPPGETGVMGRRSGADPDDAPALADEVAAQRNLDLAGVMAVAPRRGEPDEAFARLAEVTAAVRAKHPAATMLSAGMSADLEAAVRHGATHLRVGSAVLGERPALG